MDAPPIDGEQNYIIVKPRLPEVRYAVRLSRTIPGMFVLVDTIRRTALRRYRDWIDCKVQADKLNEQWRWKTRKRRREIEGLERARST